jgi:hypothetical protein
VFWPVFGCFAGLAGVVWANSFRKYNHIQNRNALEHRSRHWRLIYQTGVFFGNIRFSNRIQGTTGPPSNIQAGALVASGVLVTEGSGWRWWCWLGPGGGLYAKRPATIKTCSGVCCLHAGRYIHLEFRYIFRPFDRGCLPGGCFGAFFAI